MSIYHCRYCKRRYCHCSNCQCRCCCCRKFCYSMIYSFFEQFNNCLFGNQDDEYIDCEKGQQFKSNNEETEEIITNQPSNPNQSIKKRSPKKKCISPNTLTTKKTSSRLSSWDIVEDVYDDIHNDEYEKYNDVFED